MRLSSLLKDQPGGPRPRSDEAMGKISPLTLLLRETVDCPSRRSSCFLKREGSRCFGSENFQN
jgi:hypothetical protein